MKILSVDDSAIIRKIIKSAIQVIDGDIIEAENAEDALSIIQANKSDLDLILLDWNLPGMSGLDLLKLIKTFDDLKDIPVMMVTTESMKESIVEAIKAGAVHYLMKPFTIDELIKRVMQCTGQSNEKSREEVIFETIGTSLSETLYTMAGLDFTQTEKKNEAKDTNEVFFSFMVVVIERPVLICLSGDYETIGYIVSNMTGELPEELGEQALGDGLCELVNMTLGMTKLKMKQQEIDFKLTLPLSIRANSHGFVSKKGIKQYFRIYKNSEYYLKIELMYL